MKIKQKFPKNFSLLIKPVSSNCNLKCSYCFYTSKSKYFENNNSSVMDTTVLEKIISDYLKLRLPLSVFCWQGGEPTLAGLNFFKKVVSLQQKHGASGQVIGNALQTNGLLINDSWAKFLSEYQFLVGLSLDGPEHIHNKFRTDSSFSGSFDKVMEASNILRKNDVCFNILTTLNSATIGHERSIYPWLKSQGFKNLQFIPIVSFHDKGREILPNSITPESYLKFLLSTFDEWIDYDVGDISIRLFDDLYEYYTNNSKHNCQFQSSCKSYLLIEKNGDAFPCDFYVFPEWKIGNILETPLSLLYNMKKQKEFASLKRANISSCKNCNWYDLCVGDCTRLRIYPEEKSFLCAANKNFFSHSKEKFISIKNQT